MSQTAMALQVKKKKVIKEETGQVILRRPTIIFYYKTGKLKSNRLFRFRKEKKITYGYFHTYLKCFMHSQQHTTQIHFTHKKCEI